MLVNDTSEFFLDLRNR